MPINVPLALNRASNGLGDFRSDADGIPAVRHLATDFSSGSILPLTIKGTDSIAIVTNNPPPGGTHSLRGNLAVGLAGNDPITLKPRNDNPFDLNIAFRTSGASRNWNKVVLKWKVRFDSANNLHESGRATQMKSGYVSDTFDESTSGSFTATQRSVYAVITTGSGVVMLAKNANAGDPAPAWTETIYTTTQDSGLAYDGQWNQFKIVFNRTTRTLEFYINGKKTLSNPGRLFENDNGVYPVEPNFTFDHFSFFHASANEWSLSTNGTETAGGVQVADVEVWDGDPD